MIKILFFSLWLMRERERELGLRRAQDYLREREMVGDFNENKIKQKQMKIGFQKRKRKN
jgi:hypothetical protein